MTLLAMASPAAGSVRRAEQAGGRADDGAWERHQHLNKVKLRLKLPLSQRSPGTKIRGFLGVFNGF